MKALKIIGGIFGVLFLAGFVLWLGWLRPASPEDICDNMAALLEKQGKSIQTKGRGACIEKFSKRPWTMSGFQWAKITKCVRDAEDFDQMRACEK